MKREPVAASRIERELLESWDSMFDIIAKRGIALSGGAAGNWASAFLGVVIFGAGILLFAQASNVLLPVVTCLVGSWLIVRAITATEEGPIVVHDAGIDVKRDGREVRVHWSALERTNGWSDEQFRGSDGQVFSLPGDTRTRDAALGIVRWCADVRGEIAGAEGSLLRAVDEMAKHGRLRFRFDRRRLFGEVVFGSAAVLLLSGLAVFAYADTGEIGHLLSFGIFVAFALWIVVTALLALPDLKAEILVSTRGVSKSVDGQSVVVLSWSEIMQPAALKERWTHRLLASSADGRTRIDSSRFVHARALEAVVDHLLVRELERKGLTRTLKLADVRREPVPNTD
jgi:hypothetical protein